MSPNKIEVGKTYRNRGAGRTRRTVIAIGDAYRPDRWLSDRPRPDEPGVLYEQMGMPPARLYLSMFAAWAGSEVKGASNE